MKIKVSYNELMLIYLKKLDFYIYMENNHTFRLK